MASRALKTDPRLITNSTIAEAIHAPAIDQSKIAVRAYEIWLSRGCPHGSDHEDWYSAEAELGRQTAGIQE